LSQAGTATHRSPFDDLPSIRDRLSDGAPSLVALDFDGTLTEIMDDPEAPGLTEKRRAVLARIPAQDRRLAVVSGRSIEDVRRRVAIPQAILIGNHGLEIEGPGIRETPGAELAERLTAVLAEIASAAEERGAWIENKRWTGSVHTRPRDDARLHADVGRVIEGAVRAAGFEIRAGKATWEVRPAGARHKGGAVLRLIEALPGATARRTLYAGDDATDEDAFRALEDGITIRVGEPGASTAARYRLAAPDEVYQLLDSLFPTTHTGT
jgi:trehalose 6-phosphate phosphatase